jgi:transcriptional regulator with XRE-family HTH domain
VDFYQRIGARLRTFRLRAHLSQAALGARLGLTAGAINRYEMGRRRVPLRAIPRMASILGIAPMTLLGTEAAGRRGGGSERFPDRVREESAAYGRRASRPDAAARAYAASLSPARLRVLAKRAGVGPRPDTAPLRRYAELIAKDFARRTGRL